MQPMVTLITALLLAPLAALHATEPPLAVPLSPMPVWADYYPSRGDFKEEITKVLFAQFKWVEPNQQAAKENKAP